MTNKHIGKIVANYKILEDSNKKDTSHHTLYKCECIFCGSIELRSYRVLRQQKGEICPHYDSLGFPSMRIHNSINSRISHIFNLMKRRCYDPKNKSYRWYGGKGIKICDEWIYSPSSFVKWSLENGYEENLTIDRIDASKDYSPQNCKWITMEENARKDKKSNLITVNGMTLTGRQWSKEIKKGVNYVNTYIRTHGIDNTKEMIKLRLSGEFA